MVKSAHQAIENCDIEMFKTQIDDLVNFFVEFE